MSDENDAGDSGDWRNEQQRKQSAQNLKKTIGALTREEIVELVSDKLGIDLKNRDEQRKLQELLQWGIRVREGVSKVVWWAALALLGGFGSWFASQHWK